MKQIVLTCHITMLQLQPHRAVMQLSYEQILRNSIWKDDLCFGV